MNVYKISKQNQIIQDEIWALQREKEVKAENIKLKRELKKLKE